MMKKLLAMTSLAAIAAVATGQTFWRFDAAEGDGRSNAAGKTPKELCNDLFGEDYYSKSPVNDPPGAFMPSVKALREAHRKGELDSVVVPRAYVLRGGCWYLDAKDCSSARRYAIGFGSVPEQLIGFRICCVLPGELVFTGKKML